MLPRCHLLLRQLQQALQPGMPVAIYCGSGASADSSGIPYWLAHVKGAQGSAAKMKVRSEEGIPHSFRPPKRRSVQEECITSQLTSWLSI